MSIITIREQQKTETGFKAVLKFDGDNEYQIEVCDPFTPLDEERLEWYFERWLVFPGLDTVKAEAAKVSVRSYGESLFEQVFKRDVDAYSEYKGIRSSIRQIEIIGNSPEFQALHWEALHDPQMPRPLAVDRVMVRKLVEARAEQAIVAPSAVINLLVVTARPGEENDVNHRTISRPLIELIQQSNLRVNVDLLRPATFEALSNHLEEKGAGFYHIVHLDMHGAVMSYEQLKSMPRDRFTFRAFGEQVESFEGVKGFLSFESGIPGKSDLRVAAELADLLTGKNVPVCILNACQSAKQVRGDERETSLGAALMAAGMQTVLAMGYSVTVTAAKILMTTLYQQLFAQKSLDEAIRLGRKALCDRQERKAYFNQTISLEDWLLPVVYRRGQVDFGLRSFTPQEEEAYWQQQELAYRFEAPPYGFVGRDLEILKIERSLLRQNVLLVQGMGGTGKTTLLNYLREWWQTTQFVKEVFYFGYDQKAHTLEQILFAIGQRVYDKYEAAQFQVMSVGAQVQKLAATLNSQPFGLMLDNLESVTGQALAIQNTLDLQEQEKLRDFLRRLVGGKTKVVLGSRSREAWLDGVLKGAVYELRGLDQESRTALAEKILARQVQNEGKIERLRKSDDFKKLMKLLAGHPLAMEGVLENLRCRSAAEVLAGLDSGDVTLDSGSADKTASILKCVEYSHSNLSSDAQKLLVCLATFSGFLFHSALPQYAEQLRQLAPFERYPFEQFDGAIEEAIDWGLLSPINVDNPHLLTIQPVFPYFLKTKLNQLDVATRKALSEGFKNHYLGGARHYNRLMDSKEPQERQTGIDFCQLEYENLYNALQISLNAKDKLTIQIYACLNQYLGLVKDKKGKFALAQSVYDKLAAYPIEEHSFEIELIILGLLDCLAREYLEAKDYEKSREYYKITLDLIQKREELIPKEVKGKVLANTYHQLGRVAEELREFEEARHNYQQALQINIEFNDRYNQASTYHQLGSVALELREFEEARHNYQQALQIKIEFNDRYNQASTYQQLGVVALELREFEEARHNYQQALQIKIEFNDRYNQASTYQQLGVVALELREFEEARHNYQQALQIKIEFNDRYNQASTYQQLGVVALELREFEEARHNYQQALQIKIEFNDRYNQASTYHNLGVVAEELREFEQARTHYQQSLQIKIEFNDRYAQAVTYHQLGTVARQLREFEEARKNYQQALQINIEFNDRYAQARTCHQLGVVAQELRELEEARQNYQQALQIYIEFDDRYSQASTYHNLGIVAQELREFEQARTDYQQALQIFIEFNDRYSQASTYGQLGFLAEAEGNQAEAKTCLQQALEIFVEFGDEYRAAIAQQSLDRLSS
ncbi:tetratricopeptide repeat protein [Phormidesmis priestleyi]|uniref:tetratricopeptide repeat protein n=1 Tax=Phormidesmis priestleyi TaxID=268141 RepID=UPI00093472DD|nr:tetratricopeptide repeat protein [Phormidesmis priestleyi]